jgi:hypothetical protein
MKLIEKLYFKENINFILLGFIFQPHIPFIDTTNVASIFAAFPAAKATNNL